MAFWKFKMSDEGFVSDKERGDAYNKGWNVFYSNRKHLGFDKNDKVTMMPLHDDGSVHYQTMDLLKNGKIIGKIQVDKYSGDYRVMDAAGHVLDKTRHFGENHHPMHKGESQVKSPSAPEKTKVKDLPGKTYAIGDKIMEGNGKYQMVMKETASGEIYHGSPRYTVGYVALVDPQGRVMAEGTYDSGGFKSENGYGGAAELKDGITKIPIEYFDNKTPTLGVPAIVFDNSVFKHNRSEVMMHRSLRAQGKGSTGCVCPDAAGMDRVISAWQAIPAGQKPEFIETAAPISVSKHMQQEITAKMSAKGLEMANGRISKSNHTAQAETILPAIQLGNLSAPPPLIAANPVQLSGNAGNSGNSGRMA